MEIYCKIGTMPGERVKALSSKGRALRSAPKLGVRFLVKSLSAGSKPIGVVCDEIREVCGEPLYLLEMM